MPNLVESTLAVREDPPERRTSTLYVYLVSIVAAVGGFLFGFDTAIINGAVVFLRRQFALTDVQTEVAVSSLLAGCVIGASVAGFLSDRLGRKKILFLAAAVFLLSAIAAAVPRNLVEFTAARFLGGLAIGVASVLSPLYIAEISPPHIRGRLVSLNQLAIVIGILCAFVVSWLLADLGASSWRWMFASAALPSLLFLFALTAVPESPRWLVKAGRDDQALRTLSKLGHPDHALRQLNEIKETVAEQDLTLAELLRPMLRRPLLIALSLAVLSQVTGINTILYYGSLIFTEQVGQQSATSALLANVGIGVANLFGTVIALIIIDKHGRKPLLLISSGGMGLSLAFLGFAFLFQPTASMLVLGLIVAYVVCFAVGLGPGTWVLMSELFPTRIRGRAMSIATISLWSACLLVSLTFLSLVNLLRASGAFWVYAAMCAFTFVFVWRVTPETKGKTLEEIERSWKRAQR